MSEFVVPQDPEKPKDMRKHLAECLDDWADAGMNVEMERQYNKAKKFLERLPEEVLPIFDAQLDKPDSITLKNDPSYTPGFREARALMDLAEEDVEFVRTLTSVKMIVRDAKNPIEGYVSTNAVLLRGRYDQVGNKEVIEMPLSSKTGK